MRLLAPAKLNLYLRVLGRRPDGYHELETLFERIDLADELTFELHPRELRLTSDAPTLSCGEDNLVMKAARLLQAERASPCGAHIHLVKRIPISAGLGGGSSDAATALIGLNALWNIGLEHSTLVRLAATLGSDVPFFLCEGTFAIGRGRGEACEPLAITSRLIHVLVSPSVRLSTKEVFERAQFDLTVPEPSITILLHALRNGSLGELAKGLFNALEPEAIRRCPVIHDLHTCLRNGGCLGTLTSGSGPTVFGICEGADHAERVVRWLRAHGSADWTISVAASSPRSSRMSPTGSSQPALEVLRDGDH